MVLGNMGFVLLSVAIIAGVDHLEQTVTQSNYSIFTMRMLYQPRPTLKVSFRGYLTPASPEIVRLVRDL